MNSIYKYSQHSDKLISELDNYTGDDRVKDFIDKYNTWWAFFKEILETTTHTVSPRIHSLVATSKIVALCGMAEGFISERLDNKEKYRKFLSALYPEEKLLFALSFSAKSSLNGEVNQLLEKYSITGEEKYFEEIISLTNKRDEVYHGEINKIMMSFIDGDLSLLDEFFNAKLDFLYGIRSKIVHSGSPYILGAMLSSGSEAIMFYGERKDEFFTIRYPIEEFFIRAVFRGINKQPTQIDPASFLWDQYISQHSSSIARIANKLRPKV